MSKKFWDPRWLCCEVSAFGSGHDPGVVGSSSLLHTQPAFPSLSPSPCLCALSLSNEQILFKKFKNKKIERV